MNKIIIALFVLLLVASCTHNIERTSGSFSKTYNIEEFSLEKAEIKADELFKQDLDAYNKKLEEDERASEEALKEWEESQRRNNPWKYEEKQLREKLRRELADNSCSKDKWSKYEFGSYFQELSKKYSITPYDIVNGDAYIRRNISTILKIEIAKNYAKYKVVHFSKAVGIVFDNVTEKEKNDIFNRIVNNDYNCYSKLK